ncbi:ATP-binding protein [Rhizobium sp. CNPSo 4039]|uniref:ATP-binding protein n=1 Tax=Rhizobium sp. CNPSo 4039 TaxID=3021409 RepID=UPI00254A79AB|nr:ATP-binding protein [Rhizobium sp. CNPSo 4039]MDK4717096.1 PAS domain S-box protein [Rhizobium sp. CNPSo 4039]
MPAIQYPFIDIAVHPRVRERFARGEAMVMFSTGMDRVLWANGAGANLFGYDVIYDFVEQGPKPGDVTFRQIEATARGLGALGDQRTFLIRMASGFQRAVVNAAVELIRIQAGEEAVLFSSPVSSKPLSSAECAKRMIDGFDDPDTHIAVIGRDGEIVTTSAGFRTLGVTPQTARMLTTMAGAQPDRLIKRPIPTGHGYLPAAIGKLSEIPALHLLFVVETVLGHLDPTGSLAEETSPAAIEPQAEEVRKELEAAAPDEEPKAAPTAPFGDVIDAVADIEELDETPEYREDEQAEATPATGNLSETGTDATADADSTLGAVAETEVHADEHKPETVPDSENRVASETKTAAEPPPSETHTNPETRTDIENTPAEGFSFKHNGRATRFVWKIDAAGHFSEVSREFADAVGPHAAQIAGTAFADVARRFNLDPDGKIAELLARRDTWSGRTIYWPVEGTSLTVPVDLAALPTYTRSREFDGFRGFGVVRLADAIEDPMKRGMALGTQATDDTAPIAELPPEAAAASNEQSPAIEAEPSPATEEIESPAQDSAETAPISHYEPPALRISETPNRRESDKVVRLHERRTLTQTGLSLSEQAAFREIARQLEPFGKRTEPPAEQPYDGQHEHEEGTDTPPQPNAADEILSEAPETTDGHGHTDDEPPEAAIAEETVATPVVTFVEATDDNAPKTGDEAAAEAAPASAEPEEDFDPLDVLSSAIPPRVKMRTGLSSDIVDQLPLAILVHAGDRLIHGNPEFLRLTGYDSLGELEQVGGLDALLQRNDLEGKTEQPGTMMVVRADDALVPVTARLQSIRWEDGTALMLALMPVERSEPPAPPPIPEEARPERILEKVAKLQVEIEELRSTLETATDGVIIIGQDGEIRSMNRSASALFNYDDQETRGKPFVMLFAHESQKAVLDYLGGLSGHGVASVLNDGREVIGREASGGFVPLFMTMGRLNSSNGYCAVIRDITQWKRTEEELRNAKRAAETANAHKTDFLARVSHEIRTPLNAIIGFSDMMAGERFGPIGHSRYVEYATDIGRSGRHVLDIVNDLLDISKIEAGEMDLDFASVGLNEAITEAVSLVQPQANSQRVIIRTALSQAVPNVVADLRSIKQIALNILSNAIRFTPSGGQIVVSTAYEGNGSVVLRIRDTGVGMTRSELEQAMKPFRQVATNSRKRGDGTGLGLPLTKAMVDANRATFSINSAPNEGTLVEITFPSPRVLAN